MTIMQKKRIEFAPRTRLQRVESLAPRFFHEVIGLDYEHCLVTDESDLRDFLEVGERDLGSPRSSWLSRCSAGQSSFSASH
jgi:hypothetical protein